MTADKEDMTLDKYMSLPYALEIHWEAEDQLYVARVTEIPECAGHGKLRAEAMEMALDNLRDWVEDALECGEKIPEPHPIVDLPSGKWLQRVPRSMHAELTEMALKDGVSLNQLVVSILARELGYRSASPGERVPEIFGATDPSTHHWALIHTAIAVNQSWEIREATRPQLLHNEYLMRLVKGLPGKTKVKNFENDTEKTDHNYWN